MGKSPVIPNIVNSGSEPATSTGERESATAEGNLSSSGTGGHLSTATPITLAGSTSSSHIELTELFESDFSNPESESQP